MTLMEWDDANLSATDWQTKGFSLFKIGQYQDAIAAFDTALSLDPTNCQTWNFRGNALSALQQHAAALKCYDNATMINLNYHQAWFNRGLLLVEMGAYGSAIESYDRAISLYSDPCYLHARDAIYLKQKLVPLEV